ncbi:MAG TPA: SigE family RNA polymerase sigma factor [Actinomycetota bacterium]|nr:SigE family RNA polymerase sigma factor [Actinomycetota bacterium]
MEPEPPMIEVREAERTTEPSSPGGLAELYERHASGAIGLAYLLTGDRYLAEDLVQEAFVRVAGRFRHLRDSGAFEGYLRRTVVNLFTSQLRRRRLERAYLKQEATRAPAVHDDPDVASRDELWRALQRLPERQRAAVVLRYYEDRSEREVATTMRCSNAAAKSLIQRGTQALRAELGLAATDESEES